MFWSLIEWTPGILECFQQLSRNSPAPTSTGEWYNSGAVGYRQTKECPVSCPNDRQRAPDAGTTWSQSTTYSAALRVNHYSSAYFINDNLTPKLLALTTDPEIQVALLLGLRHWSRFGDNEVVWDETSFCPIINQALQDQCNIGWDLLLQGFPARRWTVAQDCHYASTPHHIEKASGIRWGSIFISSLFEFFFITWKHRTGVLHGNTPDEKEAIQRTRLIIRLVNEIFLLHDSILPEAQIEIFKHSKVELENSLTNTRENFVANTDYLLPLALQLYRYDPVPETQTRMT
jgi:hypothetical protein